MNVIIVSNIESKSTHLVSGLALKTGNLWIAIAWIYEYDICRRQSFLPGYIGLLNVLTKPRTKRIVEND